MAEITATQGSSVRADYATKHVIVNAVLFQCLWFAAILEGWQIALAPLAVLLAHFFFVVRNRSTYVACAVVVLFGCIADSVLADLGLYTFPEDNLLLLGSIPLWLCFMWVGFAASLPLSLRWLHTSPWLLIAFFAIGGPMSYYAGHKLEALTFSVEHLPIIAALWLAVGCVVLMLNQRRQAFV